MADTTLYELGSTSDRTGGIVWIQKAAATPSGFQDYQISVTNLVAVETAAISALTTRVGNAEDRLDVVESQLNKDQQGTKVANFTVTMDEGDLLFRILLKSTQAATDLIITAGTGGYGTDDIFKQRTIAYNEYDAISMGEVFNATTTIYFQITQGIAEVTLYKDTGN